jgi:hypothetical protein
MDYFFLSEKIMKNVYIFDDETKEYAGQGDAFVDPSMIPTYARPMALS